MSCICDIVNLKVYAECGGEHLDELMIKISIRSEPGF